MKQVFTNQTANGNSSSSDRLDGGRQVIAIRGTWDGATVTAEWSPDGNSGNYASLGSESTFTADGQVALVVRSGSVRLVLSDADTNTDINAWIG